MADQVELTGSAVIERLKMDLVPKRVNADDTVEYYLWAITDQQLHKYLSDAFYGQFVDSTDDLYSVTMPPQRRKNLWIFAPSMDLIDWFIDAAGDHNNEHADVDGNLKLAYVKMSSVEERLDEGEYPVVHQLTHKDTNKLYAYDIKHLPIINQLMIAQLEDNVSEEELLASMDERDKTLREQESSYQSSSQVSDIEPVDTEGLSEGDDGEDLTDIFPPEFDDDSSGLIDEDTHPDFSVSDDGFFDDEQYTDDDENTLDLDEGPVLLDSEQDDDLPATNKSDEVTSTKSIPKTLEHMLKQIDVPLLKSPTVHAESAGLDDYTHQVDEVRSQLNDQLRSLAESSKQKIISSYYEKHSIAESKIDARLDPENGDANVVDAYKLVQASNRQDLDDVSSLEKQKRQELLDQMDEFHSQYMREVLAQAEKDWQSIKDTRYVEEPIQAWRKGIIKTVDSQNDERLRRFNDWRNRIKSQYLTQVDAPILESLSKDVQNIVEQLQLEQASARQELSRSEDRLFNKSLELEKINIRRNMPVSKSVSSDITPVDDESDAELYHEDIIDDDDDVLTVDDSIDGPDDDLDIDDEPIENGDDEDDWEVDEDDDDLSLSDDADSDVLTLDKNDDDDLQLDELNDDDDDNMVSDIDYGDDLADEFPDLDDDSDELLTKEKPSSIDEFIENSSDDVDEQSVIEHTLDDINDLDLEEEDDDDVASVAPDSGTPAKSKKKSKVPSKKAKKNKPKDASSSKMSKKMMMIIGGIATLVIVGIFAGSVMLFGGNSNGLKVSPSATNTYVKGNMLSAKQDGKNVALVIKSVDGNKLTVTDVSNNKTYTINKPSSK